MNFGYDLGVLEPWFHQYGVSGVFLILALESFGVPLPGESLLVVAAILSGRGEFSFASLFFSAWAGAVCGDNVGYLIGRMLGHNLLWRYGRKIGLNAPRLRKVEAIFAHYGSVTVGFSRFVNVLRQLNGVFAGTMKMDWWRFLIFNALGGALWVLVWTTAGFYLGAHAEHIVLLVHKLGFFGAISVLIVLIVVLAFVYRHRLFAMLRRDTIGRTKE